MIAGRCPWCIAGPLVGLCIVALRASLNEPLGVLGGHIKVADGTSLGSPASIVSTMTVVAAGMLFAHAWVWL